MSKRLLVVVLLPCVAVFAHAVHAQTSLSAGHARQASDAAGHSNHQAPTYPLFAYPSVNVGSNATPAPAARRRGTHPSSAAASDPYAYDGWSNPSYDPPSLDQPWSAHAPADQLPQTGQ